MPLKSSRVCSSASIRVYAFFSFTFYLKFGETISYPKIFGMLVAVSSVIYLSIDSAKRSEIIEVDGDSGTKQSVYAFYSLGIAFLVPIGFSIKHFMIRYYKGSYNYIDQPIDSGILECLTVCIPLLWHDGYTINGMLYGGFAGVLMIIGRIFMGYSIAEGLAGPAQSIMSTNAIYLTLLTVLFDGQSLSFL